jgi:hypothetical protein
MKKKILTEATVVWPVKGCSPFSKGGEQQSDGSGKPPPPGSKPPKGGKPGKPGKGGGGSGDIIKDIEDELNGRSDDHKPGEEEGKKSDATDGKDPAEINKGIDEHGKNIDKQTERKKDLTPEEEKAAEKAKSGQSRYNGDEKSSGEPGKGEGSGHKVDYSKIQPRFNWKALVKIFLASATNRSEETYAKPARRGVSQLDIARQTGAAAIKPAEKPLDCADAKIAFCFDSSGSMGGAIAQVFANANALLKTPAFRNVDCLVFKFDTKYKMYRCNFARNAASEVTNLKDKPVDRPIKVTDVFEKHLGGGTDFSDALVNELKIAAKQKWNTLIFSDSDIMAGHNMVNLMALIKEAPRNTFVIFSDRSGYIQFRTQSGISTPNISHL